MDKDKSPFQKELNEELYAKLMKCISMFQYNNPVVEVSEDEKLSLTDFYKKYKRNFFINKNTEQPKYVFHTIHSEVQTFPDGTPKLAINLFHRPTKTTQYKILIPIEKVAETLRGIHCIQEEGLDGCNPTGRDKLIEKFNDTFYFLGIRKEVELFLKSCITCKSNVHLNIAKPPPIPIRTFYPHQRLQFDLIQMASKKKVHMARNPWNFKYILSVKCCFSKYAWLFPLQNKTVTEVHSATKFLFEKVGFPEVFHSDNGKEFVGKLMTTFLKSHNVVIKHGRPRHPQSQGQVENFNKTVKRHLRQALCNIPQEHHGKMWPLLLPGIANVYNNNYHHTIQDIPFRVYFNRQPNQMKHHIIPDDINWCYQSGEEPNTGDDGADEDDDDDEDDDEEDDDEESEDVDKTDGDNDADGDITISKNDLLQSCASASLNASFFSEKRRVDSNVEDIDHRESEAQEMEDFEMTKFPSSLYHLAKISEYTNLQALESTEYAIHKNFKSSFGAIKNISFFPGQKVLFKNPEIKQNRFSTFSFLKQNVIGTVKESCAGENYMVEIKDGETVTAKCIFKGEMVPLTEGDTEQESEKEAAELTFVQVLEIVSEVAAKTRESIFNNRMSFRCKKPVDVASLMTSYFAALDTAFYAQITTNTHQKKQLTEEADKMIQELKKKSFGYFLYGTIAWEQSRKDTMPASFFQFICHHNKDFMESHQCTDCFLSHVSCAHECCISKAKEFAMRVGLKVVKKKDTKCDAKKGKTFQPQQTTNNKRKLMEETPAEKKKSMKQNVPSSSSQTMHTSSKTDNKRKLMKETPAEKKKSMKQNVPSSSSQTMHTSSKTVQLPSIAGLNKEYIYIKKPFTSKKSVCHKDLEPGKAEASLNQNESDKKLIEYCKTENIPEFTLKHFKDVVKADQWLKMNASLFIHEVRRPTILKNDDKEFQEQMLKALTVKSEYWNEDDEDFLRFHTEFETFCKEDLILLSNKTRDNGILISMTFTNTDFEHLTDSDC